MWQVVSDTMSSLVIATIRQTFGRCLLQPTL